MSVIDLASYPKFKIISHRSETYEKVRPGIEPEAKIFERVFVKDLPGGTSGDVARVSGAPEQQREGGGEGSEHDEAHDTNGPVESDLIDELVEYDRVNDPTCRHEVRKSGRRLSFRGGDEITNQWEHRMLQFPRPMLAEW